MSDTIVIEQAAAVNKRAIEIRDELKQATSQIEDRFFDVCDLLLEAHDSAHHRDFGFMKFGDWVQASDWDLSPRQAQYCVVIAGKALLLNVDRATMKQVKVSKLKEIFRLDPDKFAEEMQQLLKDAPLLSLEEVKARVEALRASDAGTEPMAYMTLRYPESARPIIDTAFELCRKLNGDTVNSAGEPADISPGKCLEYICQEYSSDPNNKPQE